MDYDDFIPLESGSLAERYATTVRDRRLESMILAGLTSSMKGHHRARMEEDSAPFLSSPLDTISDEERSLYNHGMSIAEFLLREYSASTLEEEGFFVQLAVEVVQRIAEEIPSAETAGRSRMPGIEP